RSGLATDATAAEGRIDVVDLLGLRDAQRLLGHDLVREDREVGLELATVDRDHSGARPQPHARDRVFAPTGGLDEGLGHRCVLRTANCSCERVSGREAGAPSAVAPRADAWGPDGS